MTTVSYSKARENFAEILDQVEDRQEPVIVTRRGHEDMAIIPAAELQSLQETAYLLRSPRNASRLLKALAASRRGEGERRDIDQLAREFGITSRKSKDE